MAIEGKKIYLGNSPVTLIKDNGFVHVDPAEAVAVPPYSTDLLRWFEADNPGGSPSSTWTDLSGNQNGTIGSNLTYTSGTPSYYSFSGASTDVNNVVDASPSPVTGTTNHTAIVWFRTASSNDGVLSYVGSRLSGSFQKIVLRTTSTGYIRVEFEGAGTTTSLAYSTNTWYQAAYVFDGTTTGDVKVYLNTSSQQAGGTTTLNMNSTYCWSGAQQSFHAFNGDVANWLIYDRAFSASEITEVFDYYKGNYGY